MSSIAHRTRNIRNGRSIRAKKETLDKDVILDWSKGPKENLKTILTSLCKKTGITNGQRLSYLNFFTKFCIKMDVINTKTVGISVEEIFCCLRVTLFLESAEVRASGLRAMRYLLTNEESVDALYKNNLHLLIARSLDIELHNLSERIQSLRLIRKLLAMKPEALPPALIRSVISIARDGLVGPEKDSMGRACMGCLGEMVLLNPKACSETGGITALLDCILMSNQTHHITEALINCILFLLNDPRLRCYLRSDMDLRQFVAPFTDCHYSLPLLALNTQRRDDITETSEQRETRLNAAKIALVSILRSWPGLINICSISDNPDRQFNPLRSLIEMLHLPYKEIRKHIIELVFELFYLSLPLWTSDFTAALNSCSPAIIQDSWHLYDGFVAAEGRSVLPHVFKQRPNLIDNYLSLLLYTFLSNGLLDGLVDVIIVPSDAENSVRAILLVGELLHLSSHLLPPELAQSYYSLPRLVDAALSTSNTPEQRDIASAAITCLNRMHTTKTNRTIPHSLYLNQLLYFCKTLSPSSALSSTSSSFKSSPSSGINSSTTSDQAATTPSSSSHRSRKSHFTSSSSKFKYRSSSLSSSFSVIYRKENDETTLMTYIRDSQVLKADPMKWDWDLIGCILKSPSESMRKLEDSNHRLFVKKLLNYYKPNSRLFSKLRSEDESGYEISNVGCYLVDFLLESEETKANDYLTEFLSDINDCLTQVTRENNTMPDTILNCTNILRTWSHAYFLFIGRLTASLKGRKILQKLGIQQSLVDLISISTNDCYMKLIVSSFNYCQDDNFSRSLLIKILNCKTESARLYATNFMRILLRAEISDFRNWALELLTQRLADESQAVILAAIDILDEACDSPSNLDSLISLQPNLLRVGDRGLLLLIRYLSTSHGFKFLKDTNFLNYEIDRWRKYFNLKYVKIVEDSLNETLSYHQRNESGTYGRRSDKKVNYKKSVYLPAHLYGELVKQEEGYNLVVQEKFLDPLFETVRKSVMSSELSVLQLKAALWALGAVGSSPQGFSLIAESDIIVDIIKLTCDSPVLSIRGTGYFVLGLLSSTDDGADYLKSYGWEAIRHTREDKWPLCREMIGLNAQAGLFLYPQSKREHSWSVSSADTRITDICAAVFSGKLKSLNPVNSFVFADDTVAQMDDVLYSSLPALEAKEIFAEMKSLTLGKNFTSPLQLVRDAQLSSLNYSSRSDIRPRSSSDSQRRNHDDELGSTPDQSGLWLRDDKIHDKLESHFEPGSATSSSVFPRDTMSEGSVNQECSKGSITWSSPMSHQSIESNTNLHPVHERPKRKISEPGHYPNFTSPDSPHEKKDSHYESAVNANKTGSLNDSRTDSGSYESALKTVNAKNFYKRSPSHDTAVVHSREFYGSSRGHFWSANRDLAFSSIPSAMDVRGYKTLRSIQRTRNLSLGIHRQGIAGEDESSFLDDLISCDKSDNDGQSLTSDSRYFTDTETDNHSTISNVTDSIRYMGICLPVDLTLIFLKKEEMDEPFEKPDHSDPSLSTRDAHLTIEPRSRTNTTNTSNHSYKDESGFEFHCQSSCLLCSYNEFLGYRGKISSHLTKENNIIDFPANNESDDNLSSVEKYENKTKLLTIQEPFFPSYASSSPETRNTSLPKNSKLTDVLEMRREVIRSVSYLVGWFEVIKLAEQNLLSLKQKYPTAFQDICLYSEISLQLASYNFRLPARRFLQELFMDLSFEQLYPDIEAIYEKNKPFYGQYYEYPSRDR